MRVQPPPPPRRSRPTGRAPGFYPGLRMGSSPPDGTRRWRKGTARSPSKRKDPGSSPGRRTQRHAPLGKPAIPSDPQSGDCEFEPRTEHARPHRPMAKPPALQAGASGFEPRVGHCGVTGEVPARAHNPKNAGSNPASATKAHRAPWPVLDGKARHFILASVNGKRAGC